MKAPENHSAVGAYKGGVLEGENRVEIVNRIIPSSGGNIVCVLAEAHPLSEFAASFDHLIIARNDEFSETGQVSVVSMFFSLGFDSRGLQKCEFHFTLNKQGNFVDFEEVFLHEPMSASKGSARCVPYYPSEVSQSQLETLATKADGFLEIAKTAKDYKPIPAHHPLLREYQVRLEFVSGPKQR